MKKNLLRVVLITFNRAQHLERTLAKLLSQDSPLRDVDITILNNHSTDDTDKIVENVVASHPNVHHIINNFNIGGNANIAKALENCSTPYHWVLCDDDDYDWTAWSEVEEAISRGEKLICVGDRDLPKEELIRSDTAQLIQQMTFLPSIIYGPGVITSTALRNAYDNSYALFPHLAPVIMHINAGGKIFPLSKGIVRPSEQRADGSFTRGYAAEDIFPISRTMTFLAAFAYITEGIQDRKLSKRTFEALILSSQVGRLGFYGSVFATMRGRIYEPNFQAILRQSSFFNRIILRCIRFIQNSPFYHIIVNPQTYKLAQRFVDRINDKKRDAKNQPSIQPRA